MKNFSGFQVNITWIDVKEYDIEGPISDTTNCYFATNKMDRSMAYFMKKIVFDSPQELEVCLLALQQPSVQNIKGGILVPKGYAKEMQDSKTHILSTFYEKRESSLKDDIERRQRLRNFFSTAELKGMIEYSFQMLYTLNTKHIQHLNLKPANMIRNAQGYYSFQETGYISKVISLENDVFRSPELMKHLKDNKPVNKIDVEDKKSSDIFSLGLSFVQAATFSSPKQLKCFNDSNYSPQDSREILDVIEKRYGRDLCSLLQIMTSFDDNKRSSLEDIKNKEFRYLQNTNDREYKGGPDSTDPLASVQANPDDEAFVRKIKTQCVSYCEGRSQTLQSFFSSSDQYDGITKTITKYEFRRLLEVMNIRLSDFEVKSMNRVLDPLDSGKYNLQEFFRDAAGGGLQSGKLLSSIMKDDLPSLASEDEEILLQNTLKEEDHRGTGWLTFEQFNKVLDRHGVIFKPAIFNLVKVKFDLEFKKERVQYIKFLEALQKSVQVNDQELNESLKVIFQSIYKNYSSFEEFINKESKESYISFAGFTTYLSYDRINISENMNNKLRDILDPQNSGKIYVKEIREAFQQNVEQHVFTITSNLVNALERKDLSFNGFMQNFFAKSYYVKVSTFTDKCKDVLINGNSEFKYPQLKEELQTFSKKNKIVYAQQIFGDGSAPAASSNNDSSLNRSTREMSQSNRQTDGTQYSKKKDSSFSAIIGELKEAAKGFKRQEILKYYGLNDRKSVSLNYDTFKKYLGFFTHLEESEVSILFNQLSKNINNTKLVDATEFLSLLDIKTYDESEIKKADLVGGFNKNDVQKYSSVLIEINRLLADRGVTAKNHFQTPQSIVSRQFVEDRLKDLRFKVDDYYREFDMIFQQIGGDLNKIEISKFIEVINHFQNIASDKVTLIENKSSIVWFIKVFKAMEDQNINLNSFNRLISGGDRISQDDFNYKIERELGLRKDDNYNVFLDSISNKNGDISFTKFEEGYLKEQKAIRAINDIKSMTKSSHKVISQAFSNIDINGDGQITRNEFLEMMPIINSHLSKDDLHYLFERLDLNNSGSISLDEFRDNIQGKDALKNMQDYEKHLRAFYSELQQTIHNSRKTFDEIFLNTNEKQMTTAEFEKVVGRMGQRLDDQQKLTMVMEDLTFGGVSFNRMRLKKKYEKYMDSYKEDSYNKQAKNNFGGNNEKQEAYEFIRMIIKAVKSKNMYFSDAFRKKSYYKNDFSDALYDNLNINTKHSSDLFDSFWSYFKESQSNQIDFQVFEDAFNNESSNQKGGSGGAAKGAVNQALDRFLNENFKDCEYQFSQIDKRSVTVKEFQRALRNAGHNQQYKDSEIEDYCQEYNVTLKNGEVDYHSLLDKVKRNDNRDNRDSRDTRDNRDNRSNNNLNRSTNNFDKDFDRDDRNRNNNDRDFDRNKNNNDRDFDRNRNNSERDSDRNRNNDRDDDRYRNNDRDNDRLRASQRDDRNDDRFRRDSRDDNRNNKDDRRNNDRDNNNRSQSRFNDDSDDRRNKERNRNENNRNRDDSDSDRDRKGKKSSNQFDKRDYQKALKSFLDEMISNKCNIFDVVKDAKLDKRNDGYADERDFWQEMKYKKVKISNDEQDAISSFVTNNKGLVDYRKLDGDIRAFIDEQRKNKQSGDGDSKKKNKKKKMKQEELNKILEKFRKDMKKYLESKNVGVRYVFKRFDKDNDNFISYSEFEASLKDYRLCPFFEDYESIDGIIENLFDIFDEDKELKIDLASFTKVLFPEQSNMDIAPLLKQLKTVISGTTEAELREEYKKIDTNEDGKISFTEFQKYINSITKGKMSNVEIERLFQHFLKEKGSDTISFEHFVNVILDDHMNFEKIRNKILEYKDKKDKTLKSIYDQYAGPQGSINLHSLQMFFQVLKLDFSLDQLDELFSFLDKNGDGIIQYDEFYDAIEKAEVSPFQLLKRMRREFVKAKCDIAKELTNKSLGRDTVTFGDFKDCIQRFKVEVKPFEYDALFKKYGRNNDQILYNNFLHDLLSNKYDIEPIRKKIKEYTQKEGLSYHQFFDLFASQQDLLTFTDFQNLLVQCEANIPKDEVLEAFSAFDLNNSTKIHKNEFIDVLEGRASPQVAIGFNAMLQNALNYQPIQYMDNSLGTSTNQGGLNLMGYSTYGGQMGNLVDNQSMVQSQFVQTQYGLPNNRNQFAPQAPGNQYNNFAPGTPQAQGYQQPPNMPPQGQGQGPPQIFVNQNFEEVVLQGDSTVEEIIDKIRQVCQKRFINPFYFFTSLDKKFVCGYTNDADLEEQMTKGLGIKARSSHYIDLSQRYFVKEKKLFGYLNILKEIMGLISLVRQSMIHTIRVQGITLQVFVQNLFKTYQAKQLSADLLKAYVQSELNILTATQQEIGELFQQISSVQLDKNSTIVDSFAGFLNVTNTYDGRADPTDKIDAISAGAVLSSLKRVCGQLRISPIDLFQLKNKDEKNYKLNPKQFATILEDLEIEFSTSQLYSITQQYQLDNTIKFINIVSLIEEFPEMFRKICLNVMMCNPNMGYEVFFSHFSFDTKFSKWTRNEIKKFFLNFSYYPSEREVYTLYQVIARQDNDIYPSRLADFLGIAPNFSKNQCDQYYGQILNNIENILFEYRRKQNRPALLNKINSTIPQVNPYDQQYAQQAGQFQQPPPQDNRNYMQQQQQQQQFGQSNYLGNKNDFIQRTETVLTGLTGGQSQPNQYQKSQFSQNNLYDDPQKRYDQSPPQQYQQGYDPKRQYDQQGQQGYDQMRQQDQGYDQRRPYDQGLDPRNSQMPQQQGYGQNQQYNQQQQQQQNPFGATPSSFYNLDRNMENSRYDSPADQRRTLDQFDQRKTFDQLDQRNQQDRFGRGGPQDQSQYITPGGGPGPQQAQQAGPGGNNQQNQQSMQQQLKNKKIIDEHTELLSRSLNTKGGMELINKAGKEGLLNVNQFEQSITKFYDLVNSPALGVFIDSFLDNSNLVSVQTVFSRCNYDHRKYIDNLEINKQLGVGKKQDLNVGQKATSANEVSRVQGLRHTLLEIYQNDFGQLSETFFQNAPLIDLQIFMSITRQIFQNSAIQQQPQDKELEWLFNDIDANSGGTITYNEFELYFADNEDQIIQKRNKKLCITPQMESEIEELFRLVDIDNNKKITIDELNILFSKIGSNASAVELEEYIRRYDKDNDRTINYEEFKVIMEEKIKNEMLTSESIIDDLKKEFRKVDLRNTRSLNIGQLGQVFSNMGVQLKASELSALFVEIDVDGSKTVDIDELIAFITRNTEGTSTLAQTAILNIRSSRKFSIKDLVDTFKQMPSNYRLSFIRSQNQKGFNLPSSSLRPKVTASLIYSDLHYDNPGLIDNNLSVLDHKFNPPLFQMEFQFKQATGIPIPALDAFPREQITKRVAYISFYDSSRQYIGNTCKVEALWNPNNEDIWEFDSKQFGDQTLYARYVGYDKNKNTNLSICIELVMHYLPKKSNSKCDLEISVSHILIPLSSILRSGEATFNLVGGEPNKPANIKPEDVRSKRSGLQGIVKAFKKIESQLRININTMISNKNHLNDLAIMPDQIVMKRNYLPFYTIYREFFGYKSICKKEIDINLSCDPIFKTFCRVIDCPDTIGPISELWRNEIAPRSNKLEEQKNVFHKMMNHLYLLFNYDKFNFSPNDPTASVTCFPAVIGERNKLLGLCMEDLRIMLGVKVGQPSNLKIQESSNPFTIEELLDDNQEDDNNMFQQFISRKASQSIISRK